MVGRCIAYWNSPFLGDMLVFEGVTPTKKKQNNSLQGIRWEDELVFQPHLHFAVVAVDEGLMTGWKDVANAGALEAMKCSRNNKKKHRHPGVIQFVTFWSPSWKSLNLWKSHFFTSQSDHQQSYQDPKLFHNSIRLL